MWIRNEAPTIKLEFNRKEMEKRERERRRFSLRHKTASNVRKKREGKSIKFLMARKVSGRERQPVRDRLARNFEQSEST
jgi:hypothetical protein